MNLVSIVLASVPAQYAVYVAAACGVSAVLTAVIPAPKNPTLAKVWSILNVLGQNYGHAKSVAAVAKVAPRA